MQREFLMGVFCTGVRSNPRVMGILGIRGAQDQMRVMTRRDCLLCNLCDY